MEKVAVISLAVGLFIVFNIRFYKVLHAYAKNETGRRLWKVGGARIYFWQASIYTSTAGTILIMYILKWTSVLSF